MLVNGIEVDNLEADVPLDLPPTVKGRVLQVDGDQLCYLAGCFDEEPFSIAKRNFESQLETWMLQAGAEHSIIHLTGDNKGGRFEIATVKEYQGNRKGKPKPKHLAALRAYVQENYKNVVYHEDQEADDGMAQGNYNAYLAGTPDLSVICSGDKDLRMCSGWHLNQQTGELVCVSGYGSIHLTEGKPKQVKGYGTSFFWAQLLMGDTADNIPGLPAIGPETQVKYKGFRTKALIKLLDDCASEDQKKADKAAAKIDALKHKPCGAVAAYTILKDCTNDTESLNAVLHAYRSHYGQEPFQYTNWKNEKVTGTAGGMVLEQAQLLWMRRTVDDTVNKFIFSLSDGGTWYDTNDDSSS